MARSDYSNLPSFGSGGISPSFGPVNKRKTRKGNAKTADLFSIKSEDSSPFDSLIGAGKIALDVIQAPSRFVGGTIAGIKEDGFDLMDVPVGASRAFNEDYDPSDVFGEKDFAKGLALDIALDPLTYLTAGLGGVAKAGVTAGVKGAGRLAAKEGLEAAAESAAKTTSAIGKKQGKRVKALRKTEEIKNLEKSLPGPLSDDYLKQIDEVSKQKQKVSKRVETAKSKERATKLQNEANRLDAELKKLYDPKYARDISTREADIARGQKAVKNVAEKPDMVQLRVGVKPLGFNLPGGLSDTLSIGLGPAFSKSATAAKFAEKLPRVAAAAQTGKAIFKAGGNLDPRVSEAERIGSNLAEYDVSKRIDEISQQVKNIDQDEIKGALSKVVVNSQKIGVDVADLADDAKRAAIKSSSNEASKRLLKTYDSLSDDAKKFVQSTRERFVKAGEEDLAAGRIGGQIGGYWPTLQAGKKASDDVESLNSRNSLSGFLTEQGFQKQRTGSNLDDFNPIEAAVLWEIQRANAIGTDNMVTALARETGKKFRGDMADELAASKGYSRPSSTAAQRVLGDDTYLPTRVAQSIDKLNEVYATPKAMATMTRQLQKFTAMFKNSAYTVNPGHLAVDAIGDTWNMWLSNVPVFDPRYATKANTVATKMYKALTSENPADFKAVVKIGDEKYTFEELERALAAEGLRNSGRSVGSSGRLEEIGLEPERYFGQGPRFFGRANPRRVTRATVELMQRVGNRRDNRARAVGMIAQLQKNLDQGLARDDALAEAAVVIRSSTFDYNDLSNIEKRVFRNIIPFYTWSRKNIPYQVQALARNPGRTTLPFKAQEQSFDAEGAPERGIIPEYVRASQFLVPKEVAGAIPFLGDKPFFWNPMLPSMDLGRFQTFRTEGNTTPFELQDVLGMLNPAIKAPFEIAQGREFYTGQDITNPLSYGLRAFGGQTGAQVVRQGDPYAGEEKLFNSPIGSTRRELLGLSSQLIGLRGYSLDPNAARAQANYRLQDIQARQAAKEEARKEAGVLFNLPIIGDVTNPFTYQ